MGDDEFTYITFRFAGFNLEFRDDYVILTDLQYRKKWKLMFTRDPKNPFIILLLEQE